MAIKPTFRFLRICLFLLPALTMGPWLASTSAAEEAIEKAIENRLEKVLTLAKKDIDLAKTVLLISRHRDPALDLAPLRAELDRLTGSVRAKLVKASSAREIVDAFRETIHEEGGRVAMSGNEQNSFGKINILLSQG